jgi:hypothetical protein
VHTQQSTLLNRRRQGPLAVLVPAVYTNVNQNDSSIHYLGDKVVQLTNKPALMAPTPPRPPIASAAAVASAAAMKRGIDTPMRPPRATWSHSDEFTENVLVSRRSSASSATTTTCGMALDAKRRCTVQGGGSNSSSSFLPAGHFIARTSPPSSGTTASPPRVYPGIVLQQHHMNNTNTTSQQHPLLQNSFSGGSSGLTPATLLGVITPPLAAMAPLSAGSDSSSTSVAPMLSNRGSSDMSTAAAAPWSTSSAPMPTHAAAVWELTSASAQPAMVESTAVPVLSMVHSGHTNQYNHHQYHQEQDPTMQQYYARQYNIKQEQAFPCHQVVEIGPGTISAIGGYTSTNVGQAGIDHQEDQDAAAAGSDVGGWAVGFLRSIAGSIKRSVSP